MLPVIIIFIFVFCLSFLHMNKAFFKNNRQVTCSSHFLTIFQLEIESTHNQLDNFKKENSHHKSDVN